MKVMCLKTSNLSLPSRTIIHVSRNTFAPFISNRVSPKYNQVKRVLDRDKKLSFLIGGKGCIAVQCPDTSLSDMLGVYPPAVDTPSNSFYPKNM